MKGTIGNDKALSWPATIALGAFMALVLSFFFGAMSGDAGVFAAIGELYFLALYVLILKTGNVAKWRRVFFVSVALLFFPSFIAMLVETRGSMALSDAEVFRNETPFCHIVIPMTILPYLATGELIFPARLLEHFASAYSMLAIWLVASLTTGRGWCSWVCFYGGWDDGFSRAAKKPRLEVRDPSKKLRYYNFAVLAFVVLASLGTLTAVYCAWLCPFKTITEYAEPTDTGSYLALLVCVVLFFGLAILLPILTRKRVQCMSLCPFGAFQSLVDKLSPYRVRIDRTKCVDCGACVKACPTLSLDEESVRKGRTLITCTKCGECMRACPKGAIDYRFAWAKACGDRRGLWRSLADGCLPPAGADGGRSAPLTRRITRGFFVALDEIFSARALLVTNGFVIGSIMGGSFAIATLQRAWNLLSTGSFLLK